MKKQFEQRKEQKSLKKLKERNLNTSKKPICSHDNFFKMVFSNTKLAKELIELVFTKEEKKAFDLDKIKFEKDSHKKKLADLVLSFPFKHSKHRVDFFMILEHKSYNDKNSHEQMLKYLISIRELIISQVGRSKPIIPAYFYHGKQPLKLEKSLQKQDFKKFFDKIPLETRKSMLNFEMKVIDTKAPRIRKIVKDKKSKIWGVIKLLDEIWEIKQPSSEKVKTIIRDYFGEILKGKTKTKVDELVFGIVEYLTDTTGLKLREWEKAEKSLAEQGILKKGGTMDIKEVVKEKGRWEGRQSRNKEIIANMLKKEVDISFISEVTGVPVKEIKKLKNKS